MSQRIKENIHLLKFLGCCNNRERKALIGKGSKQLIGSICECTDNFLHHRVPVSKEQLKKMHKYRYAMRKIIKKSSLKNKKKILTQRGGFLQYLIPAAISAVASLISNAIE